MWRTCRILREIRAYLGHKVYMGVSRATGVTKLLLFGHV